jgi:hypothetical protein
MTVFVLPILLVFVLAPLAAVALVVVAATQAQPQCVVRRPRDE